jgi:hypothetical protein
MKKNVLNRSVSTQHLAVAILWQKGPGAGSFAVAHGTLGRATLAAGKGRVSASSFTIDTGSPARVELTVTSAMVGRGAFATCVSVRTKERPFAFFLRDVKPACPIFIPEYGVAVTAAGDRRSYDEIVAAVRSRDLVSTMQRYETEPEETYEVAAKRNRKLMCPTWLGLGRDMRFFEVGYSPQFGYWGYIQPRYHSTPQNIPESKDAAYGIGFCIGPGASCRSRIERRLEDGVLPILRSTQYEDDVNYHVTSFCTLETQPLGDRAVRGSEWQACYPNTGGNMLQEADRAVLKDVLQAEMRQREEETVCVFRAEAVNHGAVPRYAWFTTAIFQPTARGWHDPKPETYDASVGFSVLGTGRILAVNSMATINGCHVEHQAVTERQKAVF